MRPKVKQSIGFLECALKEFRSNDLLRMSGSTAFFTIFSLPAIPFMLITVIGKVLNFERIGPNLSKEIGDIFGQQGEELLGNLMRNIEEMNSNWLYAVAGTGFLVFAGTTLFVVIQSSLNDIWGVRPLKGKGWLLLLRKRGMSIAFVFILGLLFAVAILFDSLLDISGDKLAAFLPERFNVGLLNFVSRLFSTAIIALWFACTYKFLPDVRVPWKSVWLGSAITSILFVLVRLLLSKFLAASPLGTIYGASGTIVLVVLFVFITSFILYFGAALVKAYSITYGPGIIPKSFAEKVRLGHVD
ncbi:MAG: YihY/virulence factor BrkB family protein [Chitinophagales bacterium]|nr:YihY/virulence factor BrkB family protein [Chitinophagales bacterium]